MAEANFAIELDEKKGRVLVAKCPLQQGQIILHERPLGKCALNNAAIFLNYSYLVHGLSRDSGLVCLGCYGSLDEDEPFACPLCGLPLCGEQCQQSLPHRAECQAFQSLANGRQLSLELLSDIPTLLDIILILRCLSLRDAPNDEWFKLNQLQAFGEESPEDDIQVIQIMLDNFPDYDEELLNRLYGIITINAFEIPSCGFGEEANLAAIYATGCLPEHNCIPSCHRSFGPDLSITLRAAVELEGGQRISITYTDSLWPTMERRGHLAYSKHFQCDCQRCLDPTEAGTYLSALKCIKCPVGYYLAQDPLQENSSWQCQDCALVVPSTLAIEVNNRVAESIKNLEESGLEPEACEKFLMVHSRLLHPQHAHMLDVKHSLLHILGHYQGCLMADLSDKQLQLKEDTARCILGVADKLIPGSLFFFLIWGDSGFLILLPHSCTLDTDLLFYFCFKTKLPF